MEDGMKSHLIQLLQAKDRNALYVRRETHCDFVASSRHFQSSNKESRRESLKLASTALARVTRWQLALQFIVASFVRSSILLLHVDATEPVVKTIAPLNTTTPSRSDPPDTPTKVAALSTRLMAPC